MKLLLRSSLFAITMAFITSCATMAEQAEIDDVEKSIDDAGFGQYTLGVNVRNGVVTVTGTVEDDETRNQIVEAAKNTAGVTEVIDLISTNDVQKLPGDANN